MSVMAGTVQQRVTKVIVVNLGVKEEQVVDTANFAKDLEADEWDMLDVVNGLEDEFDLEITDAEASKFHAVGDVFNFISAWVELGL